MDADFEPTVDLFDARKSAESCVAEWGLEIGVPFALSNVSFVAPVGETRVLQAQREGDDESLHESEALDLWNGDEIERRITAFVAAGLDDFLIRAWTVIRGSYLRTSREFVEPIRALFANSAFV